ncbi:MAG: DUF2442 domain-containing protein [Candidatus Marinimicrobia bacterium]|nr:DUF2442 domain-containing protein [Candidatus Neomarinimicrobiota bacterium]
MSKAHIVENLMITDDELILKVDGKDLSLALATASPKLAAASELERSTYKISPAGYGIHWPLIDEDLSIDGLLLATEIAAQP